MFVWQMNMNRRRNNRLLNPPFINVAQNTPNTRSRPDFHMWCSRLVGHFAITCGAVHRPRPTTATYTHVIIIMITIMVIECVVIGLIWTQISMVTMCVMCDVRCAMCVYICLGIRLRCYQRDYVDIHTMRNNRKKTFGQRSVSMLWCYGVCN